MIKEIITLCGQRGVGMDRLTERIDNVPDGESGVWVKNHDYVSAAEKLADYEDLEEQGRLLKLPLADDKAEHRECVHTKATCHHEGYKCSECPLTELFCDEFYKAIDRCYEEAYASGCLAGIELGKSEAEAKLKELRGGKVQEGYT